MEMDAFTEGFVKRNWAEIGLDELLGPAPEYFDRAGDLVVVGDSISWSTPELTQDGQQIDHGAPDGTYPVYAGSHSIEDSSSVRYYVDTLFIPLAAPDRLASAIWDDEGYDKPVFLGDYACLWSPGAEAATLPHWGSGKSAKIRAIEESVLSDETLSRRGHWPDALVDPDSGANILAFPVSDVALRGYEAVDENDEPLAVLLATWSP
ncbi:hypothetical protein [Spongiactinospora sp. TRM90649]|uniref:hypothetical protein n=1 Tax=Spongiactinospora sp. TRM90649 TaxID=3031114 RepID=UPI0023F6C5CB|nr:hypothetical protein [Spongiactinospora sp. TRM90649]MDF5759418.1 hypothetical protein [Spongiactinospora sp. TRM90649]